MIRKSLPRLRIAGESASAAGIACRSGAAAKDVRGRLELTVDGDYGFSRAVPFANAKALPGEASTAGQGSWRPFFFLFPNIVSM